MSKLTAKQRARIERVSVTAKANARARKQLDVAVLAARKDGLSQRAIADAAGFSHRAIQRILEKHQANGSAT